MCMSLRLLSSALENKPLPIQAIVNYSSLYFLLDLLMDAFISKLHIQ